MRDINFYPDIFEPDQIETIWNFLRENKWEFWHQSRDDSTNFFWYMYLSDNKFFTEHLYSQIEKRIGKGFSINRVYANGQTFGLDGEFHTDDDNENAYTFLYYPNKEWDLAWGGETIIIDSEDNPNVVYPAPNLGIMFPSNWLHVGRGPSKQFSGLRITIAYKLFLK